MLPACPERDSYYLLVPAQMARARTGDIEKEWLGLGTRTKGLGAASGREAGQTVSVKRRRRELAIRARFWPRNCTVRRLSVPTSKSTPKRRHVSIQTRI